MKTRALYILFITGIVFLSYLVFGKPAALKLHYTGPFSQNVLPLDTPGIGDSLHYPIPNGNSDPNQQQSNPLYLSNPSNQTYTIEYDPETNQYVFKNKIGNIENGSPYYMSLEEYMKYDLQKSMENYWNSRSSANSKSGSSSSLIPSINIGKIGKTLFGGSTIDIRPQGSAELIFGVISSKREDPMLNKNQQRVTNFDFQEKIQMNVRAKVGDKIDFGINYNTESSFEFDNKMKLAYEGDEDEIIQQIEAGDVSFPLTGTLITGSQTLFGVKTKLKFGKVTVSSIFSQQKSESKNITVSGGAQMSEFKVTADNYEENKHFFLSQYFRDHYNEALSNLPAINSSINITKIEVWVTTVGAPIEQNRNIIAFQDLGEFKPYRNDVINPTSIPAYANYPDNRSNNLKSGLDMNLVRDINSVSNYLTGGSLKLVSGQDFEKVESARKLSSTEYTVNSKLGFISLNTRLNSDQVLAVAYQYMVVGQDSVFKVGEFSDEGIVVPNNLVVKLLKSTSLNTKIPIWNLMMKNIYSIGAYQVNSQDFRLNIVYQNPEFGVPTGFITEGDISGQPLIRALGLDRLNLQLDPYQDGVFDFIDGAATNGGTIQATNGRIYFPVVEPFGKDLRKAIDPVNPESPLAYKYSYDSLYSQTKQQARQFPDKNRFILEGRYKSTGGSEISLNAMQIPQGSVKVTAGGVPLKENVQYTVDYTLGRVKIIDEGILNSGTPINISLENNSMFSIQYKTLLGTHVDYNISKDFRLGATIMNLTQRPITPKVQTGDEPISNTIWGLDGNYQSQSLMLTKWVDKLPFIETKAPSKVNITGEFAHFIPGHPRALGNTGTSYIDDFEGSSYKTDLKQIQQWSLASVPRGQTNTGMFPEMSTTSNDISVGFNRARISWFYIDQMFTRNQTQTPDYIKNDKDIQSNHYSREIYQKEVFPNIEEKNNIPTSLSVLNLAYYPSMRGPYNYDANPTGISKGIDQQGKLNDPKSRWAGIMRQFDYTDWDGLNYEYIEFWMMDPFIDPDGSGPQNALQNGGDLYFNIGDISEDILKDGRKSFENGLPISASVVDVDTTIWGRVPKNQALTPFFDNNPSSREFQDVGYDGLSNSDERSFRVDYLNKISALFGTASLAYQNAYADPSADDFHHFEGEDYDNSKLPIFERYKYYNGVEGNSPVNNGTDTKIYYQTPNVEDINKDYTLSEEERYYQYRVQLRPDKMNVGENYITDVYTAKVTLANKSHADVKWYLFRIPISNPELRVGQINDFNSIRFMRIFLKNFDEEAHLRFATLDLVKNEWRKYGNELLEPGEFVPVDEGNLTSFEVSKVNIEENGKRVPIPYVLPPGLEREVDYSSNSLAHLNEQSLVLKVCNLLDGDARAAYKTTDFDFRRYKKLKLYTHAEESFKDKPLNSGDIKIFIRLGTDFTDNYYEYEMPLNVTPWGATADDIIWPDANAMVIELDKLLNAKTSRNTAIRESLNGEVTMSTPYSVMDGNRKITVKGTPTLSSVKTIMIGIRNPKKSGTSTSDDGESKCGEVWVNELRVTDFDEASGAAANLVIAADLADFGNLTLAGNYSSNGFGSIAQTISERQQERILGYDIATNLELGKFFNAESGLRIPMHYDYSETYKRPEFSPLNPDIKFDDDLESYKTSAERDSIRKITEDYTRRTSFNLMNVKKVRTGATERPKVYDIENFDVSYSYSSIYHRDIDIEYDDKRQYKGAIGYNFATVPKNVKPFDKIKFLKKYPSLALIRDFNFYYLPKQLGFRSDVDRLYNESLVRKKTKSLIIIDPTFVKTFSWNRSYDFRYDLSNSLKFDYTATSQARIGEPAGKVDRNDASWNYVRDSIWNSVKDLGRMTNFNQVYNINYVVPINKIPLLSWVTINASYGGTYLYTAAPLSTLDYGNTIENSNKVNLNGSANFTNLYNKVPYLKKLNMEMSKSNAQSGIRLRIPPSEDQKKDSTKLKKSLGQKVLDQTLMVLMSVKNASLSLSDANGSVLPGFMNQPKVVGMDLNTNSPGWDFVFGSQVNIAQRAAQNNWLSTNGSVNTAFIRKNTNNINGRIAAEPLKNFKIDINFLRTINASRQEYWRYDTISESYRAYSPTSTGAFSMSYMTIKTSFVKDDSKTNVSSTFTQMKNNLLIIANRLAKANKNWTSNPLWVKDSLSGVNYPDGYSRTNKDVMLYAFMSAYSGQSAASMPLTPFPKIPKPNWRVTYNGLTDIPFVAKYFKTVSITHGYTSTYNLAGYTTNILYREDMDGMAYVREELGNNYLPKYDFNTATISESFSPLINIDMTLINSFVAKLSIRTTRNLSLSFANFQLTELKSTEYIIGSGYRFKDVSLRLNVGGVNKMFKSDINIKADISIRNNKTVLRRIIENVDQVSAGARVIAINISGDYQLSQRIKFKLFYDQNITNPFVNSQYNNSNINAGISLVFSLAN